MVGKIMTNVAEEVFDVLALQKASKGLGGLGHPKLWSEPSPTTVSVGFSEL